jgi:DNA repair exonuclease SbcCD ATPase subunit
MHDIEIYEVTVTNFKSFGNAVTKIKLNTNLLTLIIGKNLDATINGQIESNGSGKTSLLLDAISFCLYDETISGVKKDKLINWVNKKNMEVSVAYKKDNVYTRIVRFRKNKGKIRKGDGVAIYQGNSELEIDYDSLNPDKDIAEAGTANKQIAETLIEMPFDIFSRIILFSGGHKHFLSLPSTSTTGPNQKDIIEELLGIAKDLSERAERLKPQITNNNREIETLKQVDTELNKQKSKIKDQLESIRNKLSAWDANKHNTIENIKTNIKKLQNIDFDKQKGLFEDIERTNEGIRKFTEKYNVNKPMIVSLKDKISKSESWVSNHEATLSKLKSQIDKFATLDFEAQEALLANKDSILKKITDVRNEITNVKNSINSTKDEISNVKSEISTIKSECLISENLMKDAAKKSSKAADEIEHLQDNKCPYCKQQFADARSRINDLQMIINDQYAVSVENEKKLVKLVAIIEGHNDVIKGHDITIMEYNKIIDEHNKVIEQYERSIKEIDKQLIFQKLSDLHKEKINRQSVINEYDNSSKIVNPHAVDDLDVVRAEIEVLESTNQRINTAIKVLEEDIKGFRRELDFKDVVSLEKSKMDLEKFISDLEREEATENPHISTLKDLESITFDQSNIDKIKQLEKLINHQKLVYKFLTHPDSFIRKSILVDKLVYLNDRLKHYLTVLGMPYRVVFSEELEAKISHFGTDMDYDQMSTGQKARINIALSFAFRDVLQDRFGKINLCILDEFLDTGLSTVGVGQAVQMIKKIAQDDKLSMFVISHKDEVVNSFSNVLEVELSNGFSSIKQ